MDGKIIVHSPERFGELFGGEDSDERASVMGIINNNNNYLSSNMVLIQVPTEDECLTPPVRTPSTSPAVQMKRIEEWLSRKARRNAVVSALAVSFCSVDTRRHICISHFQTIKSSVKSKKFAGQFLIEKKISLQ